MPGPALHWGEPNTDNSIMPVIYDYACQLVRVTDGDTVVVDIDLGFRMRAIMPIRLLGIDTAEMSTVKGKATRQWVIEWFEAHPALRVMTLKDPEKYGRWLGIIHPEDGDGIPLNDALITAGLAAKYDGHGPRGKS